jgi:WD40 repeat protein
MPTLLHNLGRSTVLIVAIAGVSTRPAFGQAQNAAEPLLPNVWEVAFSPDGTALAAAVGAPRATGHVMVWNTGDWSPRFHHGDAVSCTGVYFSSDSRLLACTNGGPDAFILDAATGRELRRWRADESKVHAICYLPGQSVIATGGVDKTIHLWDASGEKLRDLAGHTSTIYDLDASADGRILSCCGDNTARLWEAKTGLLLHTFKYGTLTRRGSFSSDGKFVCVAGYNSRPKVYDSRTYELLLDAEGGTEAALFTADTRFLITSGLDGVARIFNCDLAPPNQQVSARIASLVRDFDDDRYEVRQAATDEIKQIGLAAMTALDDAQKSLSVEVRLRARFAKRDLIKAKPTAHLPGHLADVVTISTSPDGRWVATGSKDGALKVWSTAGWSLARDFVVPKVEPVGTR